MHAIARFGAGWPAGDAGGSRYRLSGRKANLHWLWDGGSNADAESILTTNPRQALDDSLAILEPAEWSSEAWTIAAKFAYGVDERTRPSARYMKGLKPHSETQMAVAGYRLGVILKEFFEVKGRCELPADAARWGRWSILWAVVVCGAVCMCVAKRQRWRQAGNPARDVCARLTNGNSLGWSGRDFPGS
jgi:hypothetical protein